MRSPYYGEMTQRDTESWFSSKEFASRFVTHAVHMAELGKPSLTSFWQDFPISLLFCATPIHER